MLLFFTVIVLYSQQTYYYDIRLTRDLFDMSRIENNQQIESIIEGSPYLSDDFVPGVLFTTTKTKYIDVPLRYNIYGDQIEFKTTEGQIMALATPEIVEMVEFGEFTMVYIPYSNVKKIYHGFFRILEEGKASLYSKSEVLFKDASEPAPFKQAESAKFINKPDSYYIRVGVEQAKKIGNKKELINILSDHQNEITTFIKKKNIKINKPEDLKNLVQYYNTL